MLVKTLYFYEFYETLAITTLEKSYNFVTIINRHFYRQLFPSVMWINSTNLRIILLTQRVTQRELQYVNRAFTQRYTTLLLKVLSLVLEVYANSFWNMVLILLKETPQKNAHKTLPSFATRFTTTGGGLRPASVCTLWALSRAKITRAKNSSSNSSTFSEVLSLLSFTTPLDSLRSRVAPFTFYNRYTFVTLHVTPRTYITSIARIYNALPPRKLHICVLLRIRTPTTTPLPNGRKHLTTTHHVHIHNTRQHVTHTYG